MLRPKRIANVLRPAVVGDTGDRRTLQLTGVVDLAAATAIRGWVWRAGVAKVQLNATLVSAADATISIDLGAWLGPTATAGNWWLEVEIVDGAGSITTWPGAQQPASLEVRDQAA